MIPGIELDFPGLGGNRTWRVAVVLLLALVLPLSVVGSGNQPASAQAFPTEISGRVIMGTEGEDLPIGLNVVLLVVDDARQEIVATDSMLVGTSGEFRFTDFLSGPGYSYRVAADDGQYTPSVDLFPGESSFTGVEITTYAHTNSFDDIRLSTYSLWVTGIDRVERVMGVLGLITLVNSGDKVTVVDLDNEQLTGFDLLRFSLPENYTDLAVETTLPTNGTSIFEIGTGFAMAFPIPPGEYDILFSYFAEYEGDELVFPLNLPYGVDQINLSMPEGKGTVSGAGFGEPQGVFFENEAFTVVKGENYERGARIDVVFGSLPTPSLVEATQIFLRGKTYIVVIAWVAGVVMLALLVYAFFFARQRSAAMQSVSAEAYPEYAGMARAEIVETIASLDEKHDAGEIEEAEYTARRAVLTQAALSPRVTEAQPT